MQKPQAKNYIFSQKMTAGQQVSMGNYRFINKNEIFHYNIQEIVKMFLSYFYPNVKIRAVEKKLEDFVQSIEKHRQLQPMIHFSYQDVNKIQADFSDNSQFSNHEIALIKRIETHVKNRRFFGKMDKKSSQIMYFIEYVNKLSILSNDPVLKPVASYFFQQSIVKEILILFKSLAQSQKNSLRKELAKMVRTIYQAKSMLNLFFLTIQSWIEYQNKQIEQFFSNESFIYYFIVLPDDQNEKNQLPTEVIDALEMYYSKQIKLKKINPISYLLDQIKKNINLYRKNGIEQSSVIVKKKESTMTLEITLIEILNRMKNKYLANHQKYNQILNIKTDFKEVGSSSFWAKLQILFPQYKIYESIKSLIVQIVQANHLFGALLYANFEENKEVHLKNNGLKYDFNQLFISNLNREPFCYELYFWILLEKLQSQDDISNGKYQLFTQHFYSEKQDASRFFTQLTKKVDTKNYSIEQMNYILRNICLLTDSQKLHKHKKSLETIKKSAQLQQNWLNDKKTYLQELLNFYLNLFQVAVDSQFKEMQQHERQKLKDQTTQMQNLLDDCIKLFQSNKLLLLDLEFRLIQFDYFKPYLLEIKTFINTQFFKESLQSAKGRINKEFLEDMKNRLKEQLKSFSINSLSYLEFQKLFRFIRKEELKQYLQSPQIKQNLNGEKIKLIELFNKVSPPSKYVLGQNKFVQTVSRFVQIISQWNVNDELFRQLTALQKHYDMAKKNVEQKCNQQNLSIFLNQFSKLKQTLQKHQLNVFKSDKTFKCARIYFQYQELFRLAFSVSDGDAVLFEDYITQDADSDIQVLLQFLHIIKCCLAIKESNNSFQNFFEGSINDISCQQCSKFIIQITQNLVISKNTCLDFKQNAKLILKSSKFYLKPFKHGKWSLICDFSQKKADSQRFELQKFLTDKNTQKIKDKKIVDMFTLKHYRDKLCVFIEIKDNNENNEQIKGQKLNESFSSKQHKLNLDQNQKLIQFIQLFSEVQEIQTYTLELIENGYFPSFLEEKLSSQIEKMSENKDNFYGIQDIDPHQNIILLFNLDSDKNTQILQVVKNKKQQIKTLNKEWQIFLKQLWRNYYSACICNGRMMNNLIQQFLLQKPLEELRSIVDSNIHLPRGKFKKQGIKEIYNQIFEKFEDQIQKRKQKYDKSKIKQKFNIIVYFQNIEFWYHIMLSINRDIKIQDILYCNGRTTQKDIDRFFNQISKGYSEFYFILASSQLKMPIQTHLLEKLVNIDNRPNEHNLISSFYKSNVCFIDNNRDHKLYQMLYYSPRISKSIRKYDPQVPIEFSRYITNAKIYFSEQPSCGKTFQIHQDMQKNYKHLNVQYLLLSGQVTEQNTYQLLKELEDHQSNALIIQITFVTDFKIVNKILAEILFFRTLQFNLYPLYDKQLIFIELQNLENASIIESVPILKFLFTKCPSIFVKVDKLTPEKIIFSLHDEQFLVVIKTFQLLDAGRFLRQDFVEKYQKNSQQAYFLKETIFKFDYKGEHSGPIYLVKKPTEQGKNWRALIKKYIFDKIQNKKCEISAFFYKYVIKKLYENFSSFHKSFHLDAVSFYQSKLDRKERINILEIIIDNTFTYLKQYYQTGSIHRNYKITESFRQRIRQFPLLIYPLQQSDFIIPFKDVSSVPDSLKKYIQIQQGKCPPTKQIQEEEECEELVEELIPSGENTYNKINIKKKVKKMVTKIVNLTFEQKYQITQNNNKLMLKYIQDVFRLPHNYQFSEQYKLTEDNFLKMLVLMYRFKCHIPTNIMGLSGVGKTRLIEEMCRYLEKSLQHLNQRYVQIAKNQKKKQETISIRIQTDSQRKMISNTQQQENKKINKPIEFIHLYVHSGIKKNEIDGFLKTHSVYDSQNIKWILFDQFNTTSQIGLIKSLIQDRIYKGKKICDNIFFITACNPYMNMTGKKTHGHTIGLRFKNSLKQRENLQFHVYSYPPSMGKYTIDFQQLNPDEIKKYSRAIFQDIKIDNYEALSQIVKNLHTQFYQDLGQSSVSLRDVQRLAKLYKWFQSYHAILKLTKNQINIISLCTCYVAKAYSKDKVLQLISSSLNLGPQKVKSEYQRIQRIFVDNMKYLENIAKNPALIQNVFFLVISIMAKLPVLLIGAPGSSKSLAVSLIQSNLKGKKSPSKFYEQFPLVKIKRYQISQTSTSKALQKKIDQIQEIVNKASPDERCALIIDEIGLGQYSPDNPLKVLHQYTELTYGKYTVIGVSNWELDQAKMSRFLACVRDMPTQKELIETTLQIIESFKIPASFEFLKQIISEFLAKIYERFLEAWKKQSIYLEFFGLRDYYYMLKYIFREFRKISQPTNDDLAKLINHGIKTHFNGQPKSIKLFFDTCFEVNKQFKSEILTKVVNCSQLVDEIEQCKALLEPMEDSRCVMIIYSHDIVVPFINKIFTEAQAIKQKIVALHGSFYLNDIENEEYDLQKIAKISSYLPKDIILSLKDFSGAIYTAYYEVFNKNYSKVGNSMTTRISIGQFSNSKCEVHQRFNVLLFVSQQEIEKNLIDSAAINRFTKVYFDLDNLMNKEETQILQEILDWLCIIKDILKLSNNQKKESNFFVNSSKESIASLILNFRNQQLTKVTKIQRIKKILVKNRTFEIGLALKFDQFNQHSALSNLRQLVQKETQIVAQFNYVNKIVFTYDPQAQFLDNFVEQIQNQDKNLHKINQENIANIKQQASIQQIINSFYQNRHSEILILKFNTKNLNKRILDHLLFMISQKEKQSEEDREKKKNCESKQVHVIVFLDKIEQSKKPTQISYLHKFEQQYKQYPYLLKSKKLDKIQLTVESRQKNSLINQIFTAIKEFKFIGDLLKISGAYYCKNLLENEVTQIITESKVRDFYLPAALKSLKYRFQSSKYDYSKEFQYAWAQKTNTQIYLNSSIVQFINKEMVDMANNQQFSYQVYCQFINDNDVHSQSYNLIDGLRKFSQKYILKLLIFILKTLFEKGLVNWFLRASILPPTSLSDYHQQNFNIQIQTAILSFFNDNYWKKFTISTQQFKYSSIKTTIQSNEILIPEFSAFPFLKDIQTLINGLVNSLSSSLKRVNDADFNFKKNIQILKNIHLNYKQFIDLSQTIKQELDQKTKNADQDNVAQINNLENQLQEVVNKIKCEKQKFCYECNSTIKTFEDREQIYFIKDPKFFDQKVKNILLYEILLEFIIHCTQKKSLIVQQILHFVNNCFKKLHFSEQLMIILLNLKYLVTLSETLIALEIQSEDFFSKSVGDRSEMIIDPINLIPQSLFAEIQLKLSSKLFEKYLLKSQINQINSSQNQIRNFLLKFNETYFYILNLQSVSEGKHFTIPASFNALNKLMNEFSNESSNILNFFTCRVSQKICQFAPKWITIVQSLNQTVKKHEQIMIKRLPMIIEISATQIFAQWIGQIVKNRESSEEDKYFKQLEFWTEKESFFAYCDKIYSSIFLSQEQYQSLSSFKNYFTDSFGDFESIRIKFNKFYGNLTNAKTKKNIIVSLQNFSYRKCKLGEFGNPFQKENQQALNQIIERLLKVDDLNKFEENIQFGIIKYYLEIYSDLLFKNDLQKSFVLLIQTALNKDKSISNTMGLYVLKSLFKKFSYNSYLLTEWMYKNNMVRASWMQKIAIKSLISDEHLEFINEKNGLPSQIFLFIRQQMKKQSGLGSIFKNMKRNQKEIYDVLSFMLLEVRIKSKKYNQTTLGFPAFKSKEQIELFEFYRTHVKLSKMFQSQNMAESSTKNHHIFCFNIVNWIVSFIPENNSSNTPPDNPLINSFMLEQLSNQNYESKINNLFMVGGNEHKLNKKFNIISEKQIIFKCKNSCQNYFITDKNNNFQQFSCTYCNTDSDCWNEGIIIGPLEQIIKKSIIALKKPTLSQIIDLAKTSQSNIGYCQALKLYAQIEYESLFNRPQQSIQHGDKKKYRGFRPMIHEQHIKQSRNINFYTKLLLRIINQIFYHTASYFKWVKFLTEEQIRINQQNINKKYCELKELLQNQKFLTEEQAQNWLILVTNKIFTSLQKYQTQVSNLVAKKKQKITNLVEILQDQASSFSQKVQLPMINDIIINFLQKYQKSLQIETNLSKVKARNQCQELINLIFEECLSFTTTEQMLKEKKFEDYFYLHKSNDQFLKESSDVSVEKKYEQNFKNIWATSLMRSRPHDMNENQWFNFYKYEAIKHPPLKLIFSKPHILKEIEQSRVILSYLTLILDEIDGKFERKELKQISMSSLFKTNSLLKTKFTNFVKIWNKFIKQHQSLTWNQTRLQQLKPIDQNALVINLIGDDKQQFSNQSSLSVLKIIQILSKKYNSHFMQILASFPASIRKRIKIKEINPLRIYNKQILGLSVQLFVADVDSSFGYRAEYGQSYPSYSFSLNAKKIEASLYRYQNNLLTELRLIRRPLLLKENYVSFSIQKIDSLTELWQQSQQRPISKQNIEIIRNLIDQSSPNDKLTKEQQKQYLKKILNFLQLCIVKYISIPPRRRKDQEKNTLSQFIQKNHKLVQAQKLLSQFMKQPKFFSQDDFKNIAMTNILSLHDLVLQKLFKFTKESLQNNYTQKLSGQAAQKKLIEQFLAKLKKGQFGESINVNSFYEALCKMAYFKLTSQDKALKDKKILDVLVKNLYYWPKELQIKKPELVSKMNLPLKLKNFKDFIKQVEQLLDKNSQTPETISRVRMDTSSQFTRITASKKGGKSRPDQTY